MNSPRNNSGSNPIATIRLYSVITSPYPQGVMSSLKSLQRRQTERFQLRIALRVSVTNATAGEQRTEALNVSEGGMFFQTNLPLRRGASVQLVFKMPKEITHKPTAEWMCLAHVVHVRPLSSRNGSLGVGVQFDCYEVLPAAGPLSGQAQNPQS